MVKSSFGSRWAPLLLLLERNSVLLDAGADLAG
jgi:hypothetical protein